MLGLAEPVLRDIVLVGGGHSHVGVLRHFGMHPLPGARLTLVCTDPHTPYSGMLPGYVAGHYSYDDVHIDLGRLAAFARARFICGEVTGIDRVAGLVVLAGRPPIRFDCLSINTGSTPQLAQVPGAAAHAVAVKPIFQFNQRWLALLDRVRMRPGPMTIAVVGGGAGGVELLLAMQYRLQQEFHTLQRAPAELVFHLFTSDPHILPTHNAGVRQRFDAVLEARGVRVHRSAAIQEVSAHAVRTRAGEWFDVDETVWVTRAGGAAWLAATGLALDGDGFVVVNEHLQSVNDARIFAAGDVASIQGRPLEKAGVFAVRMGRPLAENLRRAVLGQLLYSYRPQRRWLALISTGDRFAVASRGALGFAGRWVWLWKDWIDRRFMRRFSEFPDMPAGEGPAGRTARFPLSVEESEQALSALAMRCGGCGAKVGASVLARTLAQLHPLRRDDVLIGLESPDDAAVVRVPPGKALVQTVDFFRAFFDDPYLFGRIAANHALGDIYAMGAEPHSALALAMLPPGLERQVEHELHQMMAGAIEVLNEAGCALVGGHTGEGQELALGFAVNGLVDGQMQGLMRKGGMRAGDVLILTKPLGTGTLFAAHAQVAARGRWVQGALRCMLQSSREASLSLRRHGATACTDVTGFGLLGHLVEMARPSAVNARIDLSALPLLEGVPDCIGAGIVSSLHAANLRARHALRNPEAFAQHARYPVLFDPQTAGGLLASVPADRAQACLEDLYRLGYPMAARIGEVLPQLGDPASVVLAP
jgi:selenide,water dikinase